MLKKLQLLFLFVFVLSTSIYAQTGTITGTVTDAATSEPLIGVNITLAGTSMGAATNLDGEYEIRGVEPGTYTLRANFVGFTSFATSVEVGTGTLTLDIELEEDVLGLEEVVVTGIASSTSRSVSPVAISKVNAEELQETNTYTGISELLGGKVSGLTVQPASGNPGGGIRFVVRSGGGLGGNGQPIIYIDGTRVDNSQIEGFGVGGQGIGALADLNPNDIASVDVLKGPAAAALYGTSGSNGVVLITTKDGRGIGGQEGALQVDYRSVYGMNTKQQDYDPDELISADEANEYIDSNPLWENQISVSGGNNSVRYFTSIGQRHEEALGPQNTLDRQSFRANFEAFPTEQLTIEANSSFTLNEISRPQNDNNIFGWLGNLILAPGGNTFNFTAEDAIRAIEDDNETNRFVGSLSANWQPIDNLTLKGSVGYDGSNFRQTQFYSPDFGYAGIINGSRSVFDRRNQQFTYDVNATYRFDVNDDINVTSVVGSQIFDRTVTSNFIEKNDFASSSIKNVGSGGLFIQGDESFLNVREAGIFTQHDFSIMDTYFISVGGRLDYASATGNEAPVIFYPQARGSVRLDQFDFAPDFFDLLKVRAAYGVTGQLPGIFDGVDVLWTAATYGIGRGAVPDQIGNPEIEPEEVSEYEFGLDADFLGAYGFELTYYMQNAAESIIGFEESPSTGLTFDDPPLNVGGVEGSGIELGINGTPVRSRNFQFDFNILYSYQTNEVTDLGGAQPIFDGFDINVIQEGLPKSAFYVLDVDGAAFDGSGAYAGPNVSSERVHKGNPYPTHNGSVRLNFSFLDGFEFYTLIDWAADLQVYNNTKIFQILFANDQEYNDIVSRFQSLSPGDDGYVDAANDLANMNPNYDGNFIYDADYIKIREVSLSYNFNNLIEQTPLSGSVRNLSLAVAARNLFTLTDYPGNDPEVNFTGARSLTRGADFLTLPVPRVFYATLNLGF
ncbi:MAG: TonB-dependent receptor [Gracilimonas sp.]|nr:TonB-dependent receptor [Gracilimonas sp.]